MQVNRKIVAKNTCTYRTNLSRKFSSDYNESKLRMKQLNDMKLREIKLLRAIQFKLSIAFITERPNLVKMGVILILES